MSKRKARNIGVSPSFKRCDTEEIAETSDKSATSSAADIERRIHEATLLHQQSIHKIGFETSVEVVNKGPQSENRSESTTQQQQQQDGTSTMADTGTMEDSASSHNDEDDANDEEEEYEEDTSQQSPATRSTQTTVRHSKRRSRSSSQTRLERKRKREKQRRDEFSSTFVKLLSVLIKVDPEFSAEAQLRERRKTAGGNTNVSVDSSCKKRKKSDDDNENSVFSRAELVVRATEALETLHERSNALEKALEESKALLSSTRIQCSALSGTSGGNTTTTPSATINLLRSSLLTPQSGAPISLGAGTSLTTSAHESIIANESKLSLDSFPVRTAHELSTAGLLASTELQRSPSLTTSLGLSSSSSSSSSAAALPNSAILLACQSDPALKQQLLLTQQLHEQQQLDEQLSRSLLLQRQTQRQAHQNQALLSSLNPPLVAEASALTSPGASIAPSAALTWAQQVDPVLRQQLLLRLDRIPDQLRGTDLGTSRALLARQPELGARLQVTSSDIQPQTGMDSQNRKTTNRIARN